VTVPQEAGPACDGSVALELFEGCKESADRDARASVAEDRIRNPVWDLPASDHRRFEATMSCCGPHSFSSVVVMPRRCSVVGTSPVRSRPR